MNVKALLEARESMKWQKTFKFSSWEKKADNQMGMCKEKKKTSQEEVKQSCWLGLGLGSACLKIFTTPNFPLTLTEISGSLAFHYKPLSIKANQVLVLGWCYCWFRVASSCETDFLSHRHKSVIMESHHPKLWRATSTHYLYSAFPIYSACLYWLSNMIGLQPLLLWLEKIFLLG